MRKGLFVIMVLAFCITLKAQTSLNEAVDFQVTDINGESIRLFELLDRGQYVLINFFEADCGGCQQTIQAMIDAFPVFGCNMHDVYFMGISYIDNDSIIEQWQNRFDVEFPTIGIQGGGNEIFTEYKIRICPSFVLINPDHSVAVKAMYPFTGEDLINQLALNGARPHDCTLDPCDPPSQLFAECNNDTAFISWDIVPFAHSYKLYRQGEFIAHLQDTCFTDADIQESVEYCYSVTAVCDAGLEGEGSEEFCLTIIPEVIECDSPVNLTASVDGENVLLNWDTVGWADSFNVYRDGLCISNVVSPSFIDSVVSDGVSYCYNVTALCDEMESDPSNDECIEVLNCKEDLCEDDISLYPNPTTGRVIIDSPNKGFIRVLTLDGRVVYEGCVIKGRSFFDFSSIGSGLFIVEIAEGARITQILLAVE